MSKIIKLSRGLETIVSDEDYDYLSKTKWYASSAGGTFYAAKKGQKIVYMHRIITGATMCQEVDHVDGNSLNNRRENLRIAEHRQNLQNQKPQTGKSSRYKGVYKDRRKKTWTVQIKDRGQMRTINGIEREEIAAYIYDLLALDRFKIFARFNFPEAINLWERGGKP